MRAFVAFLFPHRWKSALAEAQGLLAAEPAVRDGLGEKLDAWLACPAWQVRNAAVKLIARLRDEPRYPRIVEKLTDRAEAGIVRRNAAEAIARIGLRSDVARTALRKALNDPYWEVRAEAARALAALFPPSKKLEDDLLDLLYGYARNGQRAIREDNFEVQMAVAQGLGHLGVTPAAFAALGDLARDEAWPVRSQTAVALAHFAARHPPFLDRARELLCEIDRQSDGAVSYFVHRDILAQALRALDTRPGDTRPEGFQALYLDPKAGWNHVRR